MFSPVRFASSYNVSCLCPCEERSPSVYPTNNSVILERNVGEERDMRRRINKKHNIHTRELSETVSCGTLSKGQKKTSRRGLEILLPGDTRTTYGALTSWLSGYGRGNDPQTSDLSVVFDSVRLNSAAGSTYWNHCCGRQALPSTRRACAASWHLLTPVPSQNYCY